MEAEREKLSFKRMGIATVSVFFIKHGNRGLLRIVVSWWRKLSAFFTYSTNYNLIVYCIKTSDFKL